MSQFEGSKSRVRCLDCVKWADNRCSVKDCKVSPKKRRICHLYEFKGEYKNRTPLEAVRIPYIDPKIRRLIKKLTRMGLTLPDNSSRPLVIPASTATANPTHPKEQSLIWTPENNDG